LVAITQPFLPPFGGALLLMAVLSIMAIAFWRSAANLEGHVRAGAQVIAEVLARQMATATEDNAAELQALDELLPGMGTPTAVRLEPGSPAVGLTLVQLNLRGQTGATVLAIGRGNQGMLPTGKEVLEEGDLLALAGTHDAVDAARNLLRIQKTPEVAGMLRMP